MATPAVAIMSAAKRTTMLRHPKLAKNVALELRLGSTAPGWVRPIARVRRRPVGGREPSATPPVPRPDVITVDGPAPWTVVVGGIAAPGGGGAAAEAGDADEPTAGVGGTSVEPTGPPPTSPVPAASNTGGESVGS